MFRNGPDALLHRVLPVASDWKVEFSPLSCPPDLPPNCVILWGP